MGRGIPFGEYRLLRRLGSGGMAEVFLAKREGPGGFAKQLVIKRILPHLAASERFTSMFLREARLAALVDHPNLVHVSSFGEIDGEYYLAMEYVDGFTLADLLQRTAVLSPGVATRIAVDVLDALFAIHSAKNDEGEPLQLVHRDVTPRNVMITRAGAVKLLDFGIAVSAEDEGLSSMGTRQYMAPEQYDGVGIDHRADLFGVGVLLYLTICGGLPFPGRPLERAKRHRRIPEGVWKVVKTALELHAADRPPDARAMQKPLELFMASRGVEGTRAHLAEIAGSLAPSPAVRVLSRITQIGPFTRRTGTVDEGAVVTTGPRYTRVVGAGMLAGLLGVGAFVLAGGADRWLDDSRGEAVALANVGDGALGADGGDRRSGARASETRGSENEADRATIPGARRVPGGPTTADGERPSAEARGAGAREALRGAAMVRGDPRTGEGPRDAARTNADRAGDRQSPRDATRTADDSASRAEADDGSGRAASDGSARSAGEGSARSAGDATATGGGHDARADTTDDGRDDTTKAPAAESTRGRDPSEPATTARSKRTAKKSEYTDAPSRRAAKKSARKKGTGQLTIDTTPWTVVYLGDKKLGMTPLQGVKLPSGKHRLRLSNPNSGAEASIVVTIRAGRTTRIRRTL
ncbi:MAG: protein kinase [Deltaproteobacteria bacterium]